MWWIGIIISLAVAAMSVTAPLIFPGLQSIAGPLFVFSAAVAAGAVAFGVWRIVRERRKPEFRLKISSANIFTFGEAPMRTGIVLGAKIWNMGGRSVVTDWSLSVIPKGGPPEVAKLRAIPDQLRLAGQSPTVIYAADALDIKTSAENIPKKPLKGKLLFQVLLEHQTVVNQSTAFELSSTDIYGTRFSVRTTVGEL